MPVEEVEDVELIPGNTEKVIKIGTELGEPFQFGLIKLLRTYADIFALTIDKSITIHRLNVDPKSKACSIKMKKFCTRKTKDNRQGDCQVT